NKTPNAGNSSPSPTPTDVRAQVEQAYLHYWDVYAEAMRSLDSSRLGEVVAEDALENHRSQVGEQKQKNQPVRISVEHDYRITIVNDSSASVEDNYVNHSVRLDPQTKEPVEEDPNKRVRRTYTLKKVDGTWRVTLVVGFRDS
ncbi:MAG: nuclear transport factor 2 family protein, partial [Vicinamibacterales bacterium]